MRYNCPLCGEIDENYIKIRCGKCGSEDVERRNELFWCPNCGEIDEDEATTICTICSSEEVTR